MRSFGSAAARSGKCTYSQYGTACVTVGTYDEMADAMKIGKPFQTRFDPPSGAPANTEDNFLPLPQWLSGQPQPTDSPPHIHTPREVARGVPT